MSCGAGRGCAGWGERERTRLLCLVVLPSGPVKPGECDSRPSVQRVAVPVVSFGIFEGCDVALLRAAVLAVEAQRIAQIDRGLRHAVVARAALLKDALDGGEHGLPGAEDGDVAPDAGAAEAALDSDGGIALPEGAAVGRFRWLRWPRGCVAAGSFRGVVVETGRRGVHLWVGLRAVARPRAEYVCRHPQHSIPCDGRSAGSGQVAMLTQRCSW